MAGEEATEESVLLDRIGTVAKAGDDLRARLYAPGLPEASLRRFELDERFEVVGADDGLEGCDAALVSTRQPRGDIQSHMEHVRASDDIPVVVLAHTGGEAVAVDLVRAGAVAVLGEGDELAITAVLSELEGSDGLLEAYDRSTAGATSDGSGRGLDPITGLLDSIAMKARIEELTANDETPRVAYARLLHVPTNPRELSHEGIGAMRRRIARQFLHLAAAVRADLYSLETIDFGLVGADLSPNDAERLARAMQDIAATYVPSGVRPLELAFGHAGPESAGEASLLIELASRARDLASQDGHGAIVSAELLALGMASSTELQSTVRLLEAVERRSHLPSGHGARVAEIAARLADELGYEGLTRSRIRLAAHVHQIGKARLPDDAVVDPATLQGELLAVYRSYPVLGAEYVGPVAGAEVASLVRSHAERVDGTGIPDGLHASQIPIGARIVAVAIAVDREVARAAATDGPSMAMAVAAARLRELAGEELDDDVAELAAQMVTRGVLAASSVALAS